MPLLAGCDGWPESQPPPPPRPAPEGSVARGTAALRAALAPPGPPVDGSLRRLGADRYAIFCAACHGAAGRGDGVVVARGHPPIPPLPADPARSMAAIAENRGGSHPFADRLSPRERWAVARHVEALRPEAAP
ncbi:cytochrome c [Roseomonas sp. NAR14]|uniref:Cytochrome c n=1 Tax=Roseomonas acroporae TaxID=2937791 RepID=A0A9X1YF28_9PROT|nr:cytochrome c [Roseomonas acroporae]MCK8787502.1 cytochrome c [Roseomonas acroporae]